MTAPILVTGATGTVGASVVRSLLGAGAEVRAAARRGVPRGDGAVPVAFDFLDPSTHARALDGVETLFLVRPPALGRPRDLVPALRTGIDAGLRHVVFLSVQGADRIPVLPHAGIERWIRASPLAWTFLRPSFFDQNLITVHGRAIRRDGVLRMPAGRGRTAFIDAEDVATIGATVLLEPARFAGRAYTLTGAEALTYGEVAGILTAVVGRPIRYDQPGLVRYVRGARHDLDPALVLTTAILYSTARLHLAGRLTTDAEGLLGRPPGTMTGFALRERAAFAPERGA